MIAYRELDEGELALLEMKLLLAAGLFGSNTLPAFPDLQRKYDALLLDEAPSNGEIELLGYAFGAQLVLEEWLDWAMLIDPEYGDAIAVAATGLEVGCSPLDMISNRLEDGENWSLAELAQQALHRLRQLGQHATERSDEPKSKLI